MVSVRFFARSTRPERDATLPLRSPVTVLKPLCGDEPLLEQALESCFLQAYPEFQIVFGVHHAADPALAAVDRLRLRFPNRDVRVVIDSTMHGSNRKLSNLINMLPFAKHDILVISDSDLHVSPDYLETLVSELAKPGTGLVTALYFGRPPTRDGWSRALGATQINHIFLPGVLLSRAMGRQDCLGSTAMFRRETLERIGGFHPLVHVLAEDNVLGQRIRNLGLSIRLADIVPTAIVPESSLGAMWQHEIRWARTIRELAPGLLCASTIQHPLFWSGLAIILADGASWSVAVFLGCWGIRAACARSVDRALRGRLGLPGFDTPLWLLPVRDTLSVVEIAASFLVDEVIWRGHKLAASGGVAVPVQAGEE
jgi:ceramide glucosyltransferase